MSTQLLLAGFHRSGTSLLAQLLHAAGLFLGDELLGAKPSNPYGHFEDVEIVRMHDDIFAAHGDSWQVDSSRAFHIGRSTWEEMSALVRRRDAEHGVWGFKDPRLCFFLGPWTHLLSAPRVVVVYRDPAECVWSLERRQSEDLHGGRGRRDRHLNFWRRPDHGLRLWVTYNRALLRFVRAHRGICTVIPFSDLQRGRPVVQEVNQGFGIDLLEVPTPSVFDFGVTSRRPGPQVVFDPRTADAAREIWSEFEALSAPCVSR